MPSSLNSRRMTMDDDNSILPPPKRTPWNKGKLIGAKPPLLARHVWSIRTKLQIERRARELAMCNLAIDSKLRGCDARQGTSRDCGTFLESTDLGFSWIVKIGRRQACNWHHQSVLLAMPRNLSSGERLKYRLYSR